MRAASPNKVLTVDDSNFPLVEVVLRDGHKDADWAWLLSNYDRLFAQRLRYVHMVDATLITNPMPPAARKLITDWMAKNLEHTAKWNVGSSVIMSSPLIRGALTAMTWIVHQPVPMHYPGSYGESLDWCVTKLEQNSMVVPFILRQKQLELLDAPGPLTRNVFSRG